MEDKFNYRKIAKKLLNKGQYKHIVYGYSRNGIKYSTGWENEMLRFKNDKDFYNFAENMYCDDVDVIYAVHSWN